MKAFDTPNLPSTHHFAIHTLLSKTSRSSSCHSFHALALAASVSTGHLLWAHAKRKTWIYQSIFLALAILFSLLAAYIFQSKLYIPVLLMEFSEMTTKVCLTAATLSLAAWSAWIGFSIQPFKEQISWMQHKSKKRLERFHRSAKLPNKGWQQHLFHEAEEEMDRAATEALVEDLRLRSLSIPRKQRFLQRAVLLENLDKNLDRILNGYKEEIRNSLGPQMGQ